MKNLRMMQMLLISTMLLVGGCGSSNDESSAPAPAPQSAASVPQPIWAPVTLPGDDAAHNNQLVEWWQWWSHLTTEDGRQIGTMQDFASTLSPSSLMSLASPLTPLIRTWNYGLRIIDVTARSSQSSGLHWDAPATPVENGYDLAYPAAPASQWAKGANGRDTLHFEQGKTVFDLEVVADKPAVMLFNKDGVFRDGPFDVHLYQRQRMQTRGWMTENGRKIRVTGTTWFEHGYSTDLALYKVNWDYFQMELADGRNIQLSQIRRFEGGPDAVWQGEIVEPDGTLTYLSKSDLDITQTKFWRKNDDCSYPVGWQLRVKDELFTVTAAADDQEVPSVGLWDGEVIISGAAAGMGAAETSGYCSGLPQSP